MQSVHSSTHMTRQKAPDPLSGVHRDRWIQLHRGQRGVRLTLLMYQRGQWEDIANVLAKRHFSSCNLMGKLSTVDCNSYLLLYFNP